MVTATEVPATIRPIDDRIQGLRMLTFRLLMNCNLRCIMCDHPLQPTKLMPLETVTNVLDRLRHPIRICYIGGEPCLWLARYPNILKRTLRDGHLVHLISNGLLYHKLPGLIDAFRTEWITTQISIDGYAESYEAIRKRASWDLLVANLRAIVKARMEGANRRAVISVNYLLMRRTLGDLPRFIEFCAREGVDVVLLTYTMIFDSMVRRGEISEDESVFHCQERANDAVNKAREIAAREGISLCAPAPLGQQNSSGPQWTGQQVNSPFPSAGPSILPSTHPVACNKPWTEAWIYEDGTVVPCCCGPHNGPVIGNVRDGLEKVWTGNQITMVRDVLANGAFPNNCRCGINITSVGRQFGEEHFFSRVREEKRKAEKRTLEAAIQTPLPA